MALQTVWIRKHMLQSPCSDTSHQERQLSENEKRVLRSIEKLSIPEWYLNNNSRPPKILSNDTPIDRRPAAWKKVSSKTAPETPVVKPNDSTVCLNGVLETKIESGGNAKKSNVADKTNRNSPTKKSPAKQKNQNLDSSAGKLKRANVSQTFPRLSPTRKIQNINIVFPQEMANKKRLMVTDLDDLSDSSVTDMTVDSLEVAKEHKIGDGEARDSREENLPQEAVPSREGSDDVIIAGSVLQEKLREARRKSPVCLFLMKRSSPVEIPRAAKNDGESQKPQLPVRSPDSTKKSVEATETKTCEKANKTQADAAKKSGGVKRKLCGCSNVAPARQPLGSGPRVSSFRPKTMLPPIPESGHFPERQKVHRNVRPTRALSSSRVKTVQPIEIDDFNCSSMSQTSLASDIIDELHQICDAKSRATPTRALSSSRVKTVQPIEIDDFNCSSVSQTSLASDIIDELNQICDTKSQATPSSKKFVRKLVKALENEVLQVSLKNEETPCESAKETFLHDETFIFGENTSEDEINSVAMSTSISIKGSDSSSESSPASPMIVNAQDNIYDWNSAPQPNGESRKKKNERQVVRFEETDSLDDDEWMYWNQNSEWNYPRTSSRLSSVSSQGVHYSGPCVSPIDQAHDLDEVFSTQSGSSNGWGTIYRTRKSDSDVWATIYKTKKIVTPRITWRRDDGTIILDSGYSDRSNSPSSSSFTEETTSFNYTGTTLTASENSSYCHDDSMERSLSPIQPEEQIPRRVLMI